jgi:hypothetical protein
MLDGERELSFYATHGKGVVSVEWTWFDLRNVPCKITDLGAQFFGREFFTDVVLG